MTLWTSSGLWGKKIHPVACFLRQVLSEHYCALINMSSKDMNIYFLALYKKTSAYHYPSIQLLPPLELCDFWISCIYPHISLWPLFLCWQLCSLMKTTEIREHKWCSCGPFRWLFPNTELSFGSRALVSARTWPLAAELFPQLTFRYITRF